MRMMGFDGVPEPKVVHYSLFKQLEFICLGCNSLVSLSSRPQQQLPSSLNVIYFPFYAVDNSQPQDRGYKEDTQLAQILTSRHPPILRQWELQQVAGTISTKRRYLLEARSFGSREEKSCKSWRCLPVERFCCSF